MDPQIQKLNDRIAKLEEILTGRGVSVEMSEKIRNIVIFDIDNSSAVTQTASASLITGDVTIGKIPTTFGRVYFRGKIYNIPLYQIT
jgi:hypothetical protein